MKRTLFIIITALLLVTLLGCELLLPQPDKPKIYFLGVGLDYKNIKNTPERPTLNHLNGTIADTKELASALYYRGKEMGVEVEITLMLQEGVTPNVNSPLYPREDKIWDQIERIKDKLSPSDIFIFYFAGHGELNVGGRSGDLVVGIEKNGDSIYDAEVLTIDELYNQLKGIKATKLLILDSCYSGGHEVPYPSLPKEREGEELRYLASQFYLLASAADEESWETNHPDDHGFMTLQLLDALGWSHEGTSEITDFDGTTYAIEGHIPAGSTSPVESGGNIYLSDLFSHIRGVKNIRQRAQTGGGPIELILFSRHW